MTIEVESQQSLTRLVGSATTDRSVWRQVLHNPSAVIGASIVLLLVLVAILAPVEKLAR